MNDADRFMDTVAAQAGCANLLLPGRQVIVARAPGRLDVMGGIADYSGALVLQLPLGEATFVAVQASEDGQIQVMSLPAAAGAPLRHLTLSADRWQWLLAGGYEQARRWFRRDQAAAWAAYPVGVLLVLAWERALVCAGGLRLLIHSDVPEGKGVSSSAALEVAAMQAVCHLLGNPIDGPELARLCQLAENRVVGAPCGIMDQMTAALGRPGQLLALLCQPAQVEGFVPVPPELGLWGIDSGIRHAVSGSDYTSVRTGAFMGYRIIAELAGLAPVARGTGNGPVQIDDRLWHGYLANISPAEFEQRFAASLPLEMTGAEFIERYGGTTDSVTRVDRQRTYAVRQPTGHPIYEHDRVRQFAAMLAGPLDEASLRHMGELMYQSHASYSACGLGSDGTDVLVELVRQAGPAAGLYGAKITGGGSGGTVAVLGRADAAEQVRAVAERYAQHSGRRPYLFAGSSPGACLFGVRRLTVPAL